MSKFVWQVAVTSNGSCWRRHKLLVDQGGFFFNAEKVLSVFEEWEIPNLLSLKAAQAVLNWILNHGGVADRGEHAIVPFSQGSVLCWCEKSQYWSTSCFLLGWASPDNFGWFCCWVYSPVNLLQIWAFLCQNLCGCPCLTLPRLLTIMW